MERSGDLIRLGRSYVSGALPPRPADGHKGTFGKLLIVGGAMGYTGAPYLAARAAVRSGCGLVFLGVPRCIWEIEAVKCASAMPFPLPDEEGRLSAAAAEPLKGLRGCDVLALGPGLGRGEGVRAVVDALLWETEQPVVLDADGLNALSENMDALEARRGRVTVLTPHDGEFARLCGRSLEDSLRRDRVESSREFAARWGCTLVRKGHRSLIALPDGRVLENTCGGNALAKGGSGDVLTGLIASLLAQGAGAERAAACGVWLHARAGDILRERMSAYCVTPEDVADKGLPAAFREALG